MKRILITGGPVHERLDAVKIITNKFRGGLMVKLAQDLTRLGAEVIYLCAPEAGAKVPEPSARLTVISHKGFRDYEDKVLKLAPTVECVILGAAVANLIPEKPWKGKFPSHDYSPGDRVNIPFLVSPRIIDQVKRVAPKAHLIGYKLLSDVSAEELIRAAYGIVLEAKATAVIANDEKKGLMQKFAVTKERGVHPMHQDAQAAWIWELLQDQYYSSEALGEYDPSPMATARVRQLIEEYKDKFVQVEQGLIFGTVAVRHPQGFVTTGRGKHELDSIAHVARVNHAERKVYTRGAQKASLNAPLLARMFENPRVSEIVHYHEQVPGLQTLPYAPPGTVRDSDRPNHVSFNIKEHGCMLLFDIEGRQM